MSFVAYSLDQGGGFISIVPLGGCDVMIFQAQIRRKSGTLNIVSMWIGVRDI